MPEIQKEDRDIVQGVIDDITNFTDAITEVMTQLKSEVQNMEDDWKDAQYAQFVDCVEELDSGIKKDLQELEEAQQDLKRRLAEYTVV